MERSIARVLIGTLLSALILHAVTNRGHAQSHDDGEVYVYLQRLPLEASRLAFSVATVTVVSDLGAEVPLSLAFGEVRPFENRRQRLFASGRVPAGRYDRLVIKVQKASLRREDGEADLFVPDTGIVVDVSFLIARGRAEVLWLTMTGAGHVAGSVSFAPDFGARVAPRPISGRAGFVSNSRASTITMFDKRLHEAALVIRTAAGPAGMTLDQRLGRLYVACTRGDEVLAIDTTAAEVVEAARLAPGDGPLEVALTPDGRTLLSANGNSNTVSFFDAAPLVHLERISVGGGPGALTIDPAGRRAFVFNTVSSSISVIDIATRRLVATLSTDAPPLRGEFSSRGDRLYVIHERSPYMTVVDPLQLSVVRRARLRIGFEAIAIDSSRGLLYLGGRSDPTIELYDPNTLLPVGSVRSPAGVAHLAIDQQENALYGVSPDTRSVVVVSLAQRKAVSEIDVGEEPSWVSVMGER